MAGADAASYRIGMDASVRPVAEPKRKATYDDVLAAFKDTERFSNAQGVALEQSSQGDPSETASFLAMDPPRHDVMRGLVARGFTPRRVIDLEPRVRALELFLGAALFRDVHADRRQAFQFAPRIHPGNDDRLHPDRRSVLRAVAEVA